MIFVTLKARSRESEGGHQSLVTTQPPALFEPVGGDCRGAESHSFAAPRTPVTMRSPVAVSPTLRPAVGTRLMGRRNTKNEECLIYRSLRNEEDSGIHAAGCVRCPIQAAEDAPPAFRTVRGSGLKWETSERSSPCRHLIRFVAATSRTDGRELTVGVFVVPYC